MPACRAVPLPLLSPALPSALSTQHQQPLVLVLVLGDFVIGDANGALDQGFLQLTGSCIFTAAHLSIFGGAHGKSRPAEFAVVTPMFFLVGTREVP